MRTLSESLEILHNYTEDTSTELFRILHLYPKMLTSGKGIDGCRFFRVVGFNKDSMTKKDLGIHDEIIPENAIIRQITIYADKSTLLYLKTPVKIVNLNCQTLYI